MRTEHYNNIHAQAIYDAFVAVRAARKALAEAIEALGDRYWVADFGDHFSVSEDYVLNHKEVPRRIICGEFDPLHCIECNENYLD